MTEQPRILQAIGGHTIEVHGAHLISNKLFDIVAMLFTAKEWFGEYGLKKIVFTDEIINATEENPEGSFGTYNNDRKEIIIALKKHFLATCRNVSNESAKNVNAKYLSFRANLWYDLLITIIHEGFHLVSWESWPARCEAGITDPVLHEEIEDDCTGNAQILIADLFRDYDIEPPSISEEPYFSSRFMQFFVQNIQNSETEWAIRQGIMIDCNLVHYDDEDKDGLSTMRAWLRMTLQGDPDEGDERWDRKARSIPMASVNPAVMVAGATEQTKEVVVKQEVNVPVVQEAKAQVAEAPVVLSEEAPVVLSNDFIMGTEADLMEVVNSSQGSFNVEDEYESVEPPSEIIAPAPAMTAQETQYLHEYIAKEAPATVITNESKCQQCQTTLPPNAKFCLECGKQVVSALPVFPRPATTVVSPPEQTVQNQFLGGAASAAPAGGVQTTPKFTQTLRNNLPNINMDVGTMKGILAEVYRRMHEHIFTKCGFQVCGVNTGNDVGFNPALVGNILQPLPIADIPRATELIIACDRYNTTTGKTQMKMPITDGTITGKASKNDNVPFYAIYINNNGIECKRILMAQKPFKTGANGYSSGALKAQQGNQISWVWDGADGLTKRRWIYKTENGIAEWL